MLKLLNFNFCKKSLRDVQFNILFHQKLISEKFGEHFAQLSCDFSEALIQFLYLTIRYELEISIA